MSKSCQATILGLKPRKIKVKKQPYLYKNFYSKVKVQKLWEIKYPGRGKTGRENCGFFSKAYVCGCHTTSKAIFHTCKSLTCPICYQKSISRQAEKTAMRLQAGSIILHQNLRHFSINTKESVQTYLEFKKLKKKVIRILRQNDCSGMLIFHAWRKRIKKWTKEVRWTTDPSRTKLKEYYKGYMYHSPHFHFVGTGTLINVKQFYAKHGFTYSNITAKNKAIDRPYKLRSRKSIKKLVQYLASHMGLVRGSHSITYFGKFAYNQLKRSSIDSGRHAEECRNCGGLLYKIIAEPYEIVGDYFEGFSIGFEYNSPVDKTDYLTSRWEKLEFKIKGFEKVVKRLV